MRFKEYSCKKEIYIKNGQQFKVKEIFKTIKCIIIKEFDDCSRLKILDIGGATGELAYYLKKELKIQKDVCVLEKQRNFVVNGAERFSKCGIRMLRGDAQKFRLHETFDVIIMCGVITIFNDFRLSIRMILEHLKKEGLAIIVSIFNDYPIDVRLCFKQKGDKVWQTGFNMFPLEDVVNFIKERGATVSVSEHIMPFDLPRQENSLRAWTVDMNGKRFLTNGLNLIYNLKILSIRRLKKQ